ncbi:MAG: lipid-A-disaccharide synthase N-terminal domain-containing protein [Neomegalonema sp.]
MESDVAQAATELPWIMQLLLVDSWYGVSLALFGLAGQSVFMCRMIVQWISSERAKKSVVPTVFWWLSIVGACMLLAYGIMRQDIVIIMAQSFGFIVYGRKLMLIYGGEKEEPIVG